ncbi:MAG: hypothetical protein IJN46_05510 [Lachnospiraceae bacterium]|nr:hypothetical protein [Lachnospiraceae bacterium]
MARGGGSRGGRGFSSGGSRGGRGFSISSGGRGRFSSGGFRGNGGSTGRRPEGGSGIYMGGDHRPARPHLITPIFINTPRTHTRTVYRTVDGNQTSNTAGNGGCATSLVSFVAIIAVLFIVVWIFSGISGSGGDKDDIVSKIERDPLPAGSVNETGYYTDNLGWIQKSTKLTEGMKAFYKKTGVQPYLYLASEKEVEQAGSLEALANSLYDKLFTDEAHFLFTYIEDSNYKWEMHFVTGTQATSVIDAEAEEIIYQKFVRYYDDTDLEDEEFFSKVFEEAAEVMMKHETNGFDVAKVALLVVGGVGIVGLIIYAVIKSRKLKLKEQKEQNEFIERMRNVPLEQFDDEEVDKELEELMKKYQDGESK